MAEPAVGGNKRQRHVIVDRGLHAARARMPDRIEMMDVGAIGGDVWQDHILDLVEAGVVEFGGILTRPSAVIARMNAHDIAKEPFRPRMSRAEAAGFQRTPLANSELYAPVD
jgi:hypothetical protein